MLLLLVSCQTDTYEKGDGRYSYLRSDFVEAHTSKSETIDKAVTDDGDTLQMMPLMKASWAHTPDSVYRCLLYYNKAEGHAEPLTAQRVPVVTYRPVEQIDTVFTDQLAFESAWISRSRKYLNIALSVKTGKDEKEDRVQHIGLICDSIRIGIEGNRHLYLRIYHRQNGVPQYYSSKKYMSMPLNGLASGTVIHLAVNTYDGEVKKLLKY